MIQKFASGRAAHCLEPVLDLRAAAALRDQLLLLISRQEPMTIDASQVSRMSTACVQVLTALAITARKTGLPLVFEGVSPVASAAFENLGLGWVISEGKS